MVDPGALAEAEYLAEKPYDASDSEQVNEARKKAGRRKKQNITFVQAIMVLPEGREWMYKLLLSCETFRTPYMNRDPDGTAFRSGKQYIGFQLLADIQKASLENHKLMLEEAVDKRLTPLYPVDGLD